MTNQPNAYDDEIDLREIFGVLIRRKKIIIAVFLLSLIASAVISLTLPKTYKTEAVISRAVLGEEVLSSSLAMEHITSDENLEKVMSQFDVHQQTDDFRKKISVQEIKGSASLKIEVKAQEADASQKILEQVTKHYLDFVQNIYDQRKRLYEEKLATIKEYQDQNQADVKILETSGKQLISSKEASSLDPIFKDIFLRNTLSDRRSSTAHLKNEEIKLRLLLSGAQEPKLVRRSVPKLVSPRIKQNIVLAGFLGLFLSIFLAFVVDFWQKGVAPKA